MGRLTTILLTLCLLAPAAAGQSPQERPTHGQAALVDRISTTRLALERIDDAAAIVRAQRDEAARKHEALAAEIRDIKKARKGASLLPDFGLQNKLRKSQEQAETLTLLNRELEALKQARLDRLQQLALTYDALIQQTAVRAKTASGQRQADLFTLLEQARRELVGVQRQLAPAPRAPRELDSAALLASDDPEELSERADAVRDEQDRLRKELAQLDGRLKQKAQEARLDREMRDFISEQEIFDEGSRVLIVPRTPAADAPADKGTDPTAAPDRDNGFEGEYDAPPGGDPSSVNGDGVMGGSQDPGTGPASSPEMGTGSGHLPDGVAPEDTPTAGPEPGDDLQTIGRRRKQIVTRLKSLQLLHDRLLEKIEDLERE